jgi:hypothetical protein
MTPDQINALGNSVQAARSALGEDYIVIGIGARGPNLDCHEGNAVATVRSGNDEATSEALSLWDAILLARGKINREREARQRAKEKSGSEQDLVIAA